MAFDFNMVAPVLGSAGNAFGQTMANQRNIGFQREQNQLDRNFQERMYGVQRNDAIADWNREAFYNDPMQQMARLRAAGLNPRLVYGNGNGFQTAPSVRGSNPDGGNQPAPRFDFDPIDNPFMGFYDLKLREAQVNSTNAATEVQKSQALNVAAQTANTLQNTKSSELRYQIENELKDTVIEKAGLENQKLRADITYTLDQNERSKLQSTSNLAKTAQEIALMKIDKLVKLENIQHSKADRDKIRQEIASMKEVVEVTKNEAAIKKADLKLKDIGIQPHDPIYWRALVDMLLGSPRKDVGLENDLKAKGYEKTEGGWRKKR